jgi:hypothetical protein
MLIGIEEALCLVLADDLAPRVVTVPSLLANVNGAGHMYVASSRQTRL